MAGKRPPRKSPQLVLLLLAALSMHLGATTYYVAKTGSDDNPGTEELPWLTVKHSRPYLHAGDTLWVKAGTYEEGYITFSVNAGTATDPIVIKSYDGWSTTIRGSVNLEKPHQRLEDFRIVVDSSDGRVQAVRVSRDSCVVSGCEITETVIDQATINGIYVGRRCGVILDNNTIHDLGIILPDRGHGHGIYFQGTYGTITNNTIYGMRGNGIHPYFEGVEPSTDNVLVAYNIVHDCGASGILMMGDSGIYHHNISYRNGGTAGFYIYQGTSQYGQVYNNVIYNNYGGGLVDKTTGPHSIRNNIIIGNAGLQLQTINATDSLDYNCYYPDGTHAFYWSTGHGNFAAYRAATSQDAQGMCADPFVADTAAHNFRLTDSSPCIDAGDPVTPFRVDLEGISAPQGAGVDIGAYEFCPTDVRTQPASDSGRTFAFTPNPVSGGFATVRCSQPSAGSATFEVFNTSGRLVRSSFVVQRSSFRVDLRSMPAGVYMVRVTAEGSSTTQKLVVAGN